MSQLESISSLDQMKRFLAADDINELDDLIRRDGLILEEMVLTGAGHTPLHVACLAGHLDLVRVLLKWRPKFAEKVNTRGFSPLHIAAARGDVEIASELLRGRPQLCSVNGLEKRIPLYYAIVNGELEVMRELLSTCRESVREKTAQQETVLHLAVKNNRFNAFTELVEHLKKLNEEEVLNQQDNKGNTVLHLAVAGQNFQVVDFMLRQQHVVVDVNACNKSGRTPLDFSRREAGDREIREILTKAGAGHGTGRSISPASVEVDQSDGDAPQSSSRHPLRILNRRKELKGDGLNALLVVAALIANATYQAVLQPPSFKIGADKSSTNGFFAPITSFWTSTLGRDFTYVIFISGNTFGLLLSVQMIICLTRDLPFKKPLLLSVVVMVQTYLSYTFFLPFTLLDIGYGLKNVELLSGLPMLISCILVLTQRYLWLLFDGAMTKLLRINLFGDMYSPRTQSVPDGAEVRKESLSNRMEFV